MLRVGGIVMIKQLPAELEKNVLTAFMMEVLSNHETLEKVLPIINKDMDQMKMNLNCSNAQYVSK